MRLNYRGGPRLDGLVSVRASARQVRNKVTIVEVEASVPVNGELRTYTGRGSAVCDLVDQPDPAVGYELALGRALKDVGRKLTRTAWRQVGHGG